MAVWLKFSSSIYCPVFKGLLSKAALFLFYNLISETKIASDADQPLTIHVSFILHHA